MKVLHLTDDAAGIGGVQSYLRTLAAELPEVGIDCEVLGAEGTVGPVGSHLTRWASPYHERIVRERLEAYQPDVVHAHNLWMRLSPLPLRSVHAAGVPVAMTVHDYHLVCPRKWMITPQDAPCGVGFGAQCLWLDCRGSHEGAAWMPYNSLRWLKVALHRRWLRRWVGLFISPSQHLASWMRRSLGLSQVVHLPNFAPRPTSEISAPSPPSTLLFSGRLSREKGVDLLVDAMPIVCENIADVSLVVAGDGPERAALESLARARGVDAAIRFVGRQPPHELDRLYGEAGIVVLPTLWMENCPVSILEAMARGRAVVATRIGGVPELIDDGVTGALFERRGREDLADVLSDLLRAPHRLREMGRAAAQVYEDRYSPGVHAHQLAQLYSELCQGPGGRRAGGGTGSAGSAAGPGAR